LVDEDVIIEKVTEIMRQTGGGPSRVNAPLGCFFIDKYENLMHPY